MTDKELYAKIVDENDFSNILLTDDDNVEFELEQVGVIPMHGVLYGILNLLKISGKAVSDEEAGIVMLELDYDEETDEYFVTTVEDDDLFDEVMEEFEKVPDEG
ncbi:MAG: DUF1292 domain-containing protein [Bacilli bacterium]|nr:DUF1292 domain-containing protein [Bacilli bacterium]MBN2696049.1 DUF1292 domain-containing protein [Bacilli bacterium]